MATAKKRRKKPGGPPHALTTQVARGGASLDAARLIIRHALESTGAKPHDAAELLGISYQTLNRLLKAADLEEIASAIRIASRRREREEKKTPCNLVTLPKIQLTPHRAVLFFVERSSQRRLNRVA